MTFLSSRSVTIASQILKKYTVLIWNFMDEVKICNRLRIDLTYEIIIHE